MSNSNLRFIPSYALMCICFLFLGNNKLQAQQTSRLKFIAELQSKGLLSPNPDFLELMSIPPDPESFRKAFDALLPGALSRMEEIVNDHKEDDKDTTSVYPIKTPVLPATVDNLYEFVTDGMLVFDVDLRGTITFGITDAEAVKITAQWKFLFQKAFPEDAAKITDKTDASGNQFINIKHDNTLIKNTDKPGYIALPGWDLTLQNEKDTGRPYLYLVLSPLQ